MNSEMHENRNGQNLYEQFLSISSDLKIVYFMHCTLQDSDLPAFPKLLVGLDGETS